MPSSSYRSGRSRIGVVIGLAALAAGSVSGCQSTPSAGAAGPEPTSTGAAASTTAATEPTATTGTEPSSAQPVPADRTLGDDGIGGLELGMSRKAALATGLVGPKQKESNPLCEIHTGRGDIEFVYLVAGKVSIIAVGPAIRMAKGIGVGDTYQDLHAQYPQTSTGEGRISVDAPGAKVAAHYRVGTDAGDEVYKDSKITEIALQADDQSCYE